MSHDAPPVQSMETDALRKPENPAPGARVEHPMDMSTFVTAAAHDMKNSIGVIAAFLEDALREMDDHNAASATDTAVRGLTHQALYETQRVNCHLVQIMAIYKIDQGHYPFDPEVLDLNAFAEDAAARVRPLASIKGIQVEVVTEALEDGEGYFDQELIFSVVVQALFNAIKYTKARICLSISQHGGQIEIRVEDDGAGFPAFMLERGFADRSSINTRTSSTGLGLFFARQVAQLHRNGPHEGTTRLENGGAFGGGCFVLTLP
ncbi:MAG: HAMP domain-containing sensor histidine kinase [Rhodoferax sp.]|nr:HAMP domain-containing sensor histidine kinase [Rhodoferax sp.]MDP3650750.1 HAMP domain-containing sensor histidine kinase [Rhodoferax sp.]